MILMMEKSHLTKYRSLIRRLFQIDKASFTPLKLLTTLDLANNQLKTIGPGTFDVMNKLFWLDLSGNQLRSIKKGVFTKKISNMVLDGECLARICTRPARILN